MNRHNGAWLTAIVFSLILVVASTSLAEEAKSPSPTTRWNDGYDLLITRSVAKELQLTDDQSQQLKKLASQRMALIDRLFQVDSLPAREHKAVHDKVQSELQSLDESLSKTLTPNQAKRAQQILNQRRLQAGEDAVGVLHPHVLQLLGLSDAEQGELAKRINLARSELRREIEQAQKRAQQKVLDSLTDEQRKRYLELIGEPFDFAQVR